MIKQPTPIPIPIMWCPYENRPCPYNYTRCPGMFCPYQ